MLDRLAHNVFEMLSSILSDPAKMAKPSIYGMPGS